MKKHYFDQNFIKFGHEITKIVHEIEKTNKERSDTRKKMVSTGDRSAKIRTYNYPQGRVTDHRINLTLYKLDEIINGNINELINPLQLEDQKLQLSSLAD